GCLEAQRVNLARFETPDHLQACVHSPTAERAQHVEGTDPAFGRLERFHVADGHRLVLPPVPRVDGAATCRDGDPEGFDLYPRVDQSAPWVQPPRLAPRPAHHHLALT